MADDTETRPRPRRRRHRNYGKQAELDAARDRWRRFEAPRPDNDLTLLGLSASWRNWR